MFNNNNSLVNTEFSPCASLYLDEEKEEVKKIAPEFNEVGDFSEKSALENILGTHFNVKNISDIVISQQTEFYAQGEYGQHWWLAFNDREDGWYIVATGCSYINCDEIEGYNFPSEMAPVCWDSKNNQLITR